jgi:hypothetical protein
MTTKVEAFNFFLKPQFNKRHYPLPESYHAFCVSLPREVPFHEKCGRLVPGLRGLCWPTSSDQISTTKYVVHHPTAVLNMDANYIAVILLRNGTCKNVWC